MSIWSLTYQQSSNSERRVPELIPVLGSQPAGDVSHKPGGRLLLLSARSAVTLATVKRAAINFAAWWTEARWVWTVCLRLLPDSVATAIWTRAVLRPSPARYLLGYRCAYCCIIGQIKLMMIYIFISPKYGSSSMMCRNVWQTRRRRRVQRQATAAAARCGHGPAPIHRRPPAIPATSPTVAPRRPPTPRRSTAARPATPPAGTPPPPRSLQTRPRRSGAAGPVGAAAARRRGRVRRRRSSPPTGRHDGRTTCCGPRASSWIAPTKRFASPASAFRFFHFRFCPGRGGGARVIVRCCKFGFVSVLFRSSDFG